MDVILLNGRLLRLLVGRRHNTNTNTKNNRVVVEREVVVYLSIGCTTQQ
jgi:hypothetical protein